MSTVVKIQNESTMTYSLRTDLNDLDKMIDSLPGYLKSDQLYGSIGGGFFTGGTAPNLTIGGLIMRLRRLKALAGDLDAKQQQRLQALEAKHDEIRQDQEDRYIAKMEREANSRLDAMRQFFEECVEDRSQCPRIYLPEVQRRTIVQELIQVMQDAGIFSDELNRKLAGTDKRLQGFVQPAPFVWDDALMPIYPEDTFWWMYRMPPTVERK